MKEYHAPYLREDLEKLTTRQLDEMLQEELQKEPADGENVRLILRILENREEDQPENGGPDLESAWESYLKRTGIALQRERKGSRMLKAASILVILAALIAVSSREVQAKSIFERFVVWTDSVFKLFSPNDTREGMEYVFQTDHPGLQQIYEALTELGVTEPVVPMWLPEGYELDEYKTLKNSSKTEIYALFQNKSNKIVFKVDIYSDNISKTYYIDEVKKTQVKSYEKAGITHHIMRNNDFWVAVWEKDNLECSLSIDCPEETLYQVLGSIYSNEQGGSI